MTNLDQISLLTLCYSTKVHYQFFPFVSRKGASEYVMTKLYQQKPIITKNIFATAFLPYRIQWHGAKVA